MTKDEIYIEILEIYRDEDFKRTLAQCDISIVLLDSLMDRLYNEANHAMTEKMLTWFKKVNKKCIRFNQWENKERPKDELIKTWNLCPMF